MTTIHTIHPTQTQVPQARVHIATLSIRLVSRARNNLEDDVLNVLQGAEIPCLHESSCIVAKNTFSNPVQNSRIKASQEILKVRTTRASGASQRSGLQRANATHCASNLRRKYHPPPPVGTRRMVSCGGYLLTIF